jgi:WbqC-like protein family
VTPGKKVAIVQSNYIPWKGYFDLIHAVDEFILFDDAQYTRRDWRNRNLIKTREGPLWLTIPVQATGNYLSPIRSIVVSGSQWRTTHWRSIAAGYARAPYFKDYKEALEGLYLGSSEEGLSAINHAFLAAVCKILGIGTRLSWSMDYEIEAGKTERIVSLCRQAGARTYLSGPSARGYLEASQFEGAGIDLRFFDYAGYPEYPQLHPPFRHDVSILDLLFNEGPAATSRMLTFG